jgi:hypothetical protein
MVKITVEVLINEGGSPIYNKPYEVTDGNSLIYPSVETVGPLIRLELEKFLETNYKDSLDNVVVDFQFNIKKDLGSPFYSIILNNMTGTKHRVSGAILGLIEQGKEEALSAVKAELGI